MKPSDLWTYRAICGGYWAKKHGAWHQVGKEVYTGWLTVPSFYKHIEHMEDHHETDNLLPLVVIAGFIAGTVIYWGFFA